MGPRRRLFNVCPQSTMFHSTQHAADVVEPTSSRVVICSYWSSPDSVWYMTEEESAKIQGNIIIRPVHPYCQEEDLQPLFSAEDLLFFARESDEDELVDVETIDDIIVEAANSEYSDDESSATDDDLEETSEGTEDDDDVEETSEGSEQSWTLELSCSTSEQGYDGDIEAGFIKSRKSPITWHSVTGHITRNDYRDVTFAESSSKKRKIVHDLAGAFDDSDSEPSLKSFRASSFEPSDPVSTATISFSAEIIEDLDDTPLLSILPSGVTPKRQVVLEI